MLGSFSLKSVSGDGGGALIYLTWHIHIMVTYSNDDDNNDDDQNDSNPNKYNHLTYPLRFTILSARFLVLMFNPNTTVTTKKTGIANRQIVTDLR